MISVILKPTDAKGQERFLQQFPTFEKSKSQKLRITVQYFSAWSKQHVFIVFVFPCVNCSDSWKAHLVMMFACSTQGTYSGRRKPGHSVVPVRTIAAYEQCICCASAAAEGDRPGASEPKCERAAASKSVSQESVEAPFAALPFQSQEANGFHTRNPSWVKL